MAGLEVTLHGRFWVTPEDIKMVEASVGIGLQRALKAAQMFGRMFAFPIR